MFLLDNAIEKVALWVTGGITHVTSLAELNAATLLIHRFKNTTSLNKGNMKTARQLPDVWACLVRAEEKSQKAKGVHSVIC